LKRLRSDRALVKLGPVFVGPGLGATAFGLECGQRGAEHRQLFVNFEPAEALGGFALGGAGPAQRCRAVVRVHSAAIRRGRCAGRRLKPVQSRRPRYTCPPFALAEASTSRTTSSLAPPRASAAVSMASRLSILSPNTEADRASRPKPIGSDRFASSARVPPRLKIAAKKPKAQPTGVAPTAAADRSKASRLGRATRPDLGAARPGSPSPRRASPGGSSPQRRGRPA
jgi:hypothetical protein